MGIFSFALTARPPFRLDYTAWALMRRPENAVDRWNDGAYRRVFAFEGRPYSVQVVQIASGSKPALEVSVRGERAGRQTVIKHISGLIKKMLSLDADLSGFYALAQRDKKLGAVSERFSGLKPPRFTSAFEAAINAISCQQLSLAVGITLLNRLAAAFGVRDEDSFPGFPEPQSLSGAKIPEIKKMGYSLAKATAITALSEKQTKEGVFDSLEAATRGTYGDAGAIKTLTALKGIGRWSAQYVLLRGLGRLNVFPEGDSGASRALSEWLGPDEAASATARFYPYGGLVYFHLLLRGLESRGYIK